MELWSYKDDFIQPIRRCAPRGIVTGRSPRLYSITEHKVTQLADDAMETVTLSENPQWVLGTDDREYRKAQRLRRALTRTLTLSIPPPARANCWQRRCTGRYTWSPYGRYLLAFDGKDWNTISVPDGKMTNLTARLPVKFWNEEDDHPDTPPSYGSAGWTKDGKSVLLYDHYDIWRVAPDGSGAKNITAGYGRAHDLQFRYVRDGHRYARALDRSREAAAAPCGEPQDAGTRASSACSIDGGDPKQLIMAAKNLSPPVKAKDADVYLLTEQDFSEFPDLVTTDGSFKELRKVSHANPQQAQTAVGNVRKWCTTRTPMACALNAALYKPENFDPKKKYPMMVYIYEKLTQNVNHFVNPAPGTSINISYYVSNGYLVLSRISFTPPAIPARAR